MLIFTCNKLKKSGRGNKVGWGGKREGEGVALRVRVKRMECEEGNRATHVYKDASLARLKGLISGWRRA